MSNSQVRLFTLLQIFATVLMVTMLAQPNSAHAVERKTTKVVRKTSPQTKLPSKREAAATQGAKKGGEAKATRTLVSKTLVSKTLVSKTRKANPVVATSRRVDAKPVRLTKAQAHAVKRKVVASKRGESKTVARQALTRKEKLAGVARSRSERSARLDKGAVRLVAHRPSVQQVPAMLVPPRVSFAEQQGLRSSDDSLELNSSVALVLDQQTNEVLFSKNDSAVLPIASLTKLMTGLVVIDANLSLDELITISSEDIDTVKGSRSRLAVGATLTRRELMHLALMSSENRAAHALGRSYPGGFDQFVRLMNAKARELGMRDTRYVEPTGLSSMNRSSARDLATLVSVAYQHPILRSLSTSPSYQLDLGHRTLEFRNSNGLIRNPDWDIGLQKTGYISEAGRCLVMQTQVAGRQLIMVFLDASGKLGRSQDAERVRRWLETQTLAPAAARPQG